MKKENLSVLIVMSSQLNGLTPTTMLTHDSCLTVKAFNNIMKSNLYHEKSIVVMSSRLNHSTPDLTMNELSSQTILNITTIYKHFKINW